MREEIEAAALFITKLVNKNLSQSNSTGHSSASSTSSDSPPDFEDQSPSPTTTTTTTTTSTPAATISTATTTTQSSNNGTNGNNNYHQSDKVEQFRQCLTKALYERFHNHWFPEQPTKGQAYRCIRLNEWDRHDITLRRACLECGIDYKDLQLPVELTLWVDPEEVTCRFGENTGSHFLVAKTKKDGGLKDQIEEIDIELLRHANLHNSPDNHYQHNQHLNNNGNVMMNNKNINNNNNNNNSSYHNYVNHQQAHHHQSPQQHNHRSSLGKAAIQNSYHHPNGGNMNFYYYYS